MSGSDLCKKERTKWDGDETCPNFSTFSKQGIIQSLTFVAVELELRKSELAALFEVSIATVSNWLRSGAMPMEKQNKLEKILSASKQVQAFKFKRIDLLIHRKIFVLAGDLFELKFSLFDFIFHSKDISLALLRLKEIDDEEAATRTQVKGCGKNLRSLSNTLEDLGFIGGGE